jgi:hypothetical protein
LCSFASRRTDRRDTRRGCAHDIIATSATARMNRDIN